MHQAGTCWRRQQNELTLNMIILAACLQSAWQYCLDNRSIVYNTRGFTQHNNRLVMLCESRLICCQSTSLVYDQTLILAHASEYTAALQELLYASSVAVVPESLRLPLGRARTSSYTNLLATQVIFGTGFVYCKAACWNSTCLC